MAKRLIDSAVLHELLLVGGMMSNVCYAIGQNQDATSEQHQRDNIKLLQVRWDTATRQLSKTKRKSKPIDTKPAE